MRKMSQAASGGGMSFLSNAMIMRALAMSGSEVFVVDIGQSYEKMIKEIEAAEALINKGGLTKCRKKR